MNNERVDFLCRNPWMNISWENTMAECDKEYLLHSKIYDKLQCDTLPEPFTGCWESQVYCLNLNPGEKDVLFELSSKNKEMYLRYTKETLCHECDENMWWKLVDHDGYCWWRRITSLLRKELKRCPQMFVTEYFPYHSKYAFAFPKKLPSYQYTDELIRMAIDDGKYILIMRYRKQWMDRIAEILKSLNLDYYDKLFYIANPRNPIFSYNNIFHYNAINSNDKSGVKELLASF